MRDLADRVRTLKQSEIRKYSAKCAAMGGVNLSQGVCDQPAPDAVKQAAKAAIDADHATYTHMRGIAALRQVIAEKMLRFNGIAADAETEIVVTVGTAGAFAATVLAVLNPGDEVVVFSPFYSYHVNVLKLFGAVVRFVDTRPPDWAFTKGAMESAIGERTRMILVNTPANPSGKVFSEDELRLVVEAATRHDLLIVTDEIYEYITYGRAHVSAARMPGGAARTVTISGASKTYAVTGWRVGYAIAPAALAEKIAVVSDQLYICSPAPLQHGIVAGMHLSEDYYRRMQRDYRVKRDLLADTLRACGFEPYIPEGSYYMLAGFEPGRYRDDTHAAESILDEVGVATVPGSAFFANPDDGRCQLRFCYAKKMADLEEACRRLTRLRVTVRS
ncbi:MAG: pyridoxal phosphate-dependent aminotransferase [Phycisphaerales bacterium]|nr:pyridoxal phosphate-dependent aminotransferase [Phycisphaerales bacterium]